MIIYVNEEECARLAFVTHFLTRCSDSLSFCQVSFFHFHNKSKYYDIRLLILFKRLKKKRKKIFRSPPSK